jgi:hypothetical protein
MRASPRYPSLTPTTLQLGLSLLTGRRRSFRKDAQAFMRYLRPPMRLLGDLPQPPAGGRLILANHYRSPRFRAWWIPFALTSLLDEDVHWVMAGAWTYPDPLRSNLLTPLTRRLFRRVAWTYGFTVMPPMPPAPREAAERASAVRELLRYASGHPRPLVGLVPEGGDSPEGDLTTPPSGVGRFISHLAARGLELVPAGVFEAEGTLCVRFGPPIVGPLGPEGTPDARDRLTAGRVMEAIAACLPDHLRGPYSAGGSTHARG